MAWQLVAEVLDHAPSELTSGEVNVLSALAEWVRLPTRETERPLAELTRRTRLTTTGLRAVFQKLARRGLEVRVPLATGKDGRPVYAFPGTAMRFRLPEFPAPPGCPCDTCRAQAPTPPEGDATASPGDATVSPSAPESIHKATPQPRQATPQCRVGDATASPGDATVSPNRFRKARAVGEGAREPAREPHPPPPKAEPDRRCARHRDLHGLIPPCGECKEARLVHEQWEADIANQRQATRQAIRNCPDCHGAGYTENDNRDPVKCKHPHLGNVIYLERAS